MCGIFGYAGFEEGGLLQRMGRAIAHRGPDDDGFFTSNSADRVHLGMRRLSIIDLAGGKQPIFNEDGSLVVFYNGEIYNYLELADELTAKGHVFSTRSDTETVLHAYEEWGIDCLKRFNGMFAFALYDRRSRELHIVRDRAGIKPLYWHQHNGRFLFGSELKAILESQHVERRCNTSVIDSYLTLRYVPNPETLLEGIHVLPAAHHLKYKDGKVEIRRWWDINLHRGPYKSQEEYKEEYDEVFTRAVKLQMRSDVPFGAYLSGGIDSSSVVAAMSMFTDKVRTFSIGFDSPIDETLDATRFAKHFHCDHRNVKCLPEHFSLLPKAIWHLERPIGDALILAYYLLAQETSKHVKVVLSGEGADELFGGYSFHKVIQLTELYNTLVPGPVNRGIVAPLMQACPVSLMTKAFVYPAYLGEKGKEKVVDYVRNYSRRSLNENYIWLKTLFGHGDKQELYSAEFRRTQSEVWMHRNKHAEHGPLLDRLLKLQFDDWLQDNLLLRQDKNCMAHSLELRVPFLDHNLIELAFLMPPDLKVRRLKDKWIEREWARKRLPSGNVGRSKNPFYLPLEYFQDHKEIKELLRLTLDPAAVKRRGMFDPAAVSSLVEKMQRGEFLYLKQVMALVILELWQRVFIDKERLW